MLPQSILWGEHFFSWISWNFFFLSSLWIYKLSFSSIAQNSSHYYTLTNIHTLQLLQSDQRNWELKSFYTWYNSEVSLSFQLKLSMWTYIFNVTFRKHKKPIIGTLSFFLLFFSWKNFEINYYFKKILN